MKSNCWNRLYFAVVLLLLAGILIGPGSAFAGLNDGLVGNYSFNACTAADDSGTGNNGYFVGNNQCVQGVQGSAMQFNGYYDHGYVNIPNSLSLSFLDNYTFTLWFNIQSYTSMSGGSGADRVTEYGLQTLFAKAGDRNGLDLRAFRSTEDGLLYLNAYGGGGCPAGVCGDITSHDGFNLNEWHMATVTSGSGEVKLYFDCELQGAMPTAEFNVNPRMKNMPLQLGIDQDAWWYPINGILDETRVYNRALSADEVIALYNSGGFSQCPGENRPPASNAGPDQTREMTSCAGAAAILNGSGSSDPDNDPLTYTWTENNSVIATGMNPTITLSYGTHTLTLTVDDGKGGTASDEVVIKVVDTTPPVLTVTLTPNVLWPPNHKYVMVTPSLTVIDACVEMTTVALLSASSSEPDNGLGDGDTANDIVINADGTISLRAERSGTGSGRVYTVIYQATDIAGNTATATATVTVPHNK